MNDNLKSLLTGAAISLTSALAGGLLVAMTMSSGIDRKVDASVQPSQPRPTDFSSFQPSHSPAKPVSFTTAPGSVPMPAAMQKASESVDVQKARAELMEAQAKFRAAMQAKALQSKLQVSLAQEPGSADGRQGR